MALFNNIALAFQDPEESGNLAALLCDLNCERTIQVSTEEELADLLAAGGVDLLMLDMDFTGKNLGADVADRIGSSHLLPVIFAVDNPDESQIVRAERHFLYGFIGKPVQKRELELELHLCSTRWKIDQGIHRATEKLELQVESAARELAKSEYRYYSLVQSLPDAVLIVDQTSNKVLYANSAAEMLYKFGKDGTKGLYLHDLMANPDASWENAPSLPGMGRSFYHVRRDGEVFPVLVTQNTSVIDDQHITAYIVRDASQQVANEFHQRRNSLLDPLTGLPDRELMEDRIAGAIERQRRNPETGYALIYIGVDNLSTINTVFGHKAGDMLLHSLAIHLSRQVHSADSVGRIEGDQFAILLEDLEHHSHAINTVNAILKSFELPFPFGTYSAIITVSCGVFLGTSTINAETVINSSQAAMFRAKQEGRSCFRIFDDTMASNYRRQKMISLELDQAVNENQFFIEYQPIHELENGQIRGFEALVRWFHPDRGLISPSEFIPVAETTGRIVKIGEWIIRHAMEQAKQWIRNAATPLYLAMNVSGLQFNSPGFLRSLDDMLAETGFPPEFLKIEITETEAMVDAYRSIEILRTLKSRGMKIAIDDFGTGFSSLSYLQQFPVDTLKIDLSFIRRIEKSSTNVKITETIIALAHTLGLEVIAEGVETLRQATILQNLKCDFGQGWFYSKPMSNREIEAYVVQNYRSPARTQRRTEA